MRIGFDAKRLFNNFTGLGNYSRFVVKALKDFYPENEYILYTPKRKTNSETDFFSLESGFKVEIPSGSQKHFKGIWRSFQLGTIATKDSVDLFHGLSNELPIVKLGNLRTVVTIHDVIFKRYPEFYKPIDRAIYNFKFKKACEQADKIVAVSRQTAEDCIEFLGADEKKITVIYQGNHPVFRRDYSQEEINNVRQKYHLPERFILNVGTIERRKNALVLIKALKQVKEKISVVIIGRSTHYQKELENFIIHNKLGDRVTFINNIHFQDLPLIYRAANLFVYPSLFEGFGIPIIEAIACGVPVITSKNSCFAEAGGPDSWYIDPINDEELAATINHILKNDELVKEKNKKSRKFIERFEPKFIAEDLMKVYSQLL